MHPRTTAILLRSKAQCPISDGDWAFPSPITGRCYHTSPIQQDYIRRAGGKAGLGDSIGWHTFRHTYRPGWMQPAHRPGAAKIDAARTGVNHDEHLWERLYEVQAQGEQQNGAHGASSCFAANQIETGLLAQPRFKHIPIQFNAYWTFLDLRRKTSNACNSMIALVAGGGFEPPTFGL